MRPFKLIPAEATRDAVALRRAAPTAHLVCGGTTQLDLMKLDVLHPDTLIDLSSLRGRAKPVEERGNWLRLDAFMTMSQALASSLLIAKAPMVVDSLAQAASRQIRNMASLGGNLLQRTRCTFYRDTSWPACNRRAPGSGCAARRSAHDDFAALGTSEACIAVYPGDFAQALVALNASLEIEGAAGMRLLPVAGLHQLPGASPEIETTLKTGEIITAIRIPILPWFARSRYVKVRDRASYEFALASAAVALDVRDGVVVNSRIALGGLSTVPWRSHDGEARLRGLRPTEANARSVADVAFAGAERRESNRARLDSGKATLVRAILETARMEMARG